MKEYVNAVYRDVPGAFPEVDPDGDVLWHVPCDAKVNVSLSFEYVLYPVVDGIYFHTFIFVEGCCTPFILST